MYLNQYQRPILMDELFRGTVLVIEDETSVRSALNRMLTARDIGVIGAATVSDAGHPDQAEGPVSRSSVM